MKPMHLLDLFSGIGGFSLGLEASGYFRTVAFCEIEAFPRRALAHRFPGVSIYDDVATLTADQLRADGIVVDAICGGFPCQDLSVAGAGEGLDGERSGLWFEYARLIRELRPRLVFVENVAALLGRGLDRVLGTLATLGYDAEWHCIPASAAGAPHERDRLWLVAYPCGFERAEWRASDTSESAGGRNPHRSGVGPHVADTNRVIGRGGKGKGGRSWIANGPQVGVGGAVVGVVSHADRSGCEQQRRAIAIRAQLASAECRGRWAVEPSLGRVVHGVPDRVAALKGLGNAVVPVIPEILGRVYGEAFA